MSLRLGYPPGNYPTGGRPLPFFLSLDPKKYAPNHFMPAWHLGHSNRLSRPRIHARFIRRLRVKASKNLVAQFPGSEKLSLLILGYRYLLNYEEICP